MPLWDCGLFSGLPNRHKYKIKKEVAAYNCQYLRKDTGLISTSIRQITINNDILTAPISESVKPTGTCDIPLFSFPLVGGESSHGRIYENQVFGKCLNYFFGVEIVNPKNPTKMITAITISEKNAFTIVVQIIAAVSCPASQAIQAVKIGLNRSK